MSQFEEKLASAKSANEPNFDFLKIPYETLRAIIKKMDFPSMVALMKASSVSKCLLERELWTVFVKANNNFIKSKDDEITREILVLGGEIRAGMNEVRQALETSDRNKLPNTVMPRFEALRLLLKKSNNISSKFIIAPNRR